MREIKNSAAFRPYGIFAMDANLNDKYLKIMYSKKANALKCN